MKNFDNDNDELSFISIGAATRNVVRYLESSDKQKEERERDAQRSGDERDAQRAVQVWEDFQTEEELIDGYCVRRSYPAR
jgi:hypothetical protein